MTEPTIISGLKRKLMTSVTPFYKRLPASGATDPVKRVVQRALDKENTMPRDIGLPHDDVQQPMMTRTA